MVINPGLIQGPSIVSNADFSSGLIVNRFMNNAYPGMPKIMMGIVDVRECAQAHLQGIKVAEAANNRFILLSEALWFKDVARILSENFPEWNIKHKELPYCPVKFLSFFD